MRFLNSSAVALGNTLFVWPGGLGCPLHLKKSWLLSGVSHICTNILRLTEHNLFSCLHVFMICFYQCDTHSTVDLNRWKVCKWQTTGLRSFLFRNGDISTCATEPKMCITLLQFQCPVHARETTWSSWYFPHYLHDSIKTLKKLWNTNCINITIFRTQYWNNCTTLIHFVRYKDGIAIMTILMHI